MAGNQRRHTQLKRQAAGPKGTTEKKQRGRTRLDASKPGKVTEIERSGRIGPAVNRLAKEKRVKRELKVPQSDFDRAVEAARRASVNITVSNLSGTRKKTVKA